MLSFNAIKCYLMLLNAFNVLNDSIHFTYQIHICLKSDFMNFNILM